MGRYDDVLSATLSEREDNNELALARAEQALYLDRLDECAQHLRRVRKAESLDSARIQLIEAELDYWGGSIEKATETLGEVIDTLRRSEDGVLLEIRAKLLLARCALRDGKHLDALERLHEPRRMAVAAGNDYLVGLSLYFRAQIQQRLSNNEECLADAEQAATLLARVGARRWAGQAKSIAASVQADEKRFGDAIALSEAATAIAVDLKITRDVIWAEHNAARSTLLAGDVASAASRLQALIDDERWTLNAHAELTTLYLLAFAYILQERVEEVERLGGEIAQLAGVVPSEIFPYDGDLIAAWAGARLGRTGSIDRLCKLVLEAKRFSPLRIVDARVLVADALAVEHPEFSSVMVEAARAVPQLRDRTLSGAVLARTCRLLKAGPIAWIGDRLWIAVDHPLPDYDETLVRTRRMLMLQAYLASRGVQARAARRLNMTRSNYNSLWLKLRDSVPPLIEVIEDAARPIGLRKRNPKNSNDEAGVVTERHRRGSTAASSTLPAAVSVDRSKRAQAKAKGKRDASKGRRSKS